MRFQVVASIVTARPPWYPAPHPRTGESLPHPEVSYETGSGNQHSAQVLKQNRRFERELTPGGYACVQEQLAAVQVVLSQPSAPIETDWVNPWMFEISYAWGVQESPVSGTRGEGWIGQ